MYYSIFSIILSSEQHIPLNRVFSELNKRMRNYQVSVWVTVLGGWSHSLFGKTVFPARTYEWSLPMTGLQLCFPELSQYVWNPPHMCLCAHTSACSVSLMFSVSSSSDSGLQFSQQKCGLHIAQEWVKWKRLLKCEYPYKQSEQHACELPRPVL